MKNAIPRAPKGLGPRGRALWRELNETFDFSSDPHRRFLLEDAARTADLVARMQEVVDNAADLRVRGSQGQPVAMPEVAELRQYRALLAQVIRSMALPETPELEAIKAEHISAVRRQARLKVVK